MDIPIKKCFGDVNFTSSYNLVCINSINWGRVLAQIAHFFFAYYQLCDEIGQEVQFVVPTGAGGNLTGKSNNMILILRINIFCKFTDNVIWNYISRNQS